jgi:hypothetical protein
MRASAGQDAPTEFQARREITDEGAGRLLSARQVLGLPGLRALPRRLLL